MQETFDLRQGVLRSVFLAVFILCTMSPYQTGAGPGLEDIPQPCPCQLAWQEAEFGVLVCYELHTFNAWRS